MRYITVILALLMILSCGPGDPESTDLVYVFFENGSLEVNGKDVKSGDNLNLDYNTNVNIKFTSDPAEKVIFRHFCIEYAYSVYNDCDYYEDPEINLNRDRNLLGIDMRTYIYSINNVSYIPEANSVVFGSTKDYSLYIYNLDTGKTDLVATDTSSYGAFEGYLDLGSSLYNYETKKSIAVEDRYYYSLERSVVFNNGSIVWDNGTITNIPDSYYRTTLKWNKDGSRLYYLFNSDLCYVSDIDGQRRVMATAGLAEEESFIVSDNNIFFVGSNELYKYNEVDDSLTSIDLGTILNDGNIELFMDYSSEYPVIRTGKNFYRYINGAYSLVDSAEEDSIYTQIDDSTYIITKSNAGVEGHLGLLLYEKGLETVIAD